MGSSKGCKWRTRVRDQPPPEKQIHPKIMCGPPQNSSLVQSLWSAMRFNTGFLPCPFEWWFLPPLCSAIIFFWMLTRVKQAFSSALGILSLPKLPFPPYDCTSQCVSSIWLLTSVCLTFTAFLSLLFIYLYFEINDTKTPKSSDSQISMGIPNRTPKNFQ